MKPLIEFVEVGYTYPNGTEALRDINIKILRGEAVAIMGENGAGKTTLAKLMLGLLRPTKGHVLIDGIDTWKTTTAQIARKVGYIFQNPLYQLFSETVEKEVALGPKALGMGADLVAERVETTLKEMGIYQIRGMPPLSLSEGERKRVTIASVLSMDPEALIIDEPTLGQDEVERLRLIQIIKRQLTKGKTAIIISHDVDFAFEVAERFIIMKKGRILGIFSKSELINKNDMLIEANLITPQILEINLMLKRKNLLTGNSLYDLNGLATSILNAFRSKLK